MARRLSARRVAAVVAFVAIAIAGTAAWTAGTTEAAGGSLLEWPIPPNEVPLVCSLGPDDLVWTPGVGVKHPPVRHPGPYLDPPLPLPTTPRAEGFLEKPSSPEDVAHNIAVSKRHLFPGEAQAVVTYRVVEQDDDSAAILGELAGVPVFLAHAVRLDDGSWTWRNESLYRGPDGLWSWETGEYIACASDLQAPL